MGFEKIKFKGTFRDYQNRVLDRAEAFLSDGKIHVVAAPGAGKTVLGLELLRKMGKTALILSPTITIRQQWKQRLEENFLPDGENVNDYVSEDLHKPKLLTSVTYQALYCAMRGLQDKEENELTGETEKVEYADFDFWNQLKAAGIGVVCLDEAHHLRNEWFKALKDLLKDGGITVIALTATPPYDSEKSEWEKYVELCGEIDFEIIAPELVQTGSLCPHQDYVYFNYPTEEEMEKLKEFYARTDEAFDEFATSEYPAAIAKNLLIIPEDELFKNAAEYIAVCSLLRYLGWDMPKSFRKKLTLHGNLPAPKKSVLETALNFIIRSPEAFSADIIEGVGKFFKQRALTDRGRVRFSRNEGLNRMLAASIGKLQSVSEIAEHESLHMGEKLRMLILADFVRKESLPVVGTKEPLGEISMVSLFEVIRRNKKADRSIGVVSGSLVILPSSLQAELAVLSARVGVNFTVAPLNCEEYVQVLFSGGNKSKVRVMTELLESGKLHILIGTKSLLGEGWDSPCVNTLILASYVGSYVLSNQMRGRAIRVDKRQKDKVSNVWHLATVEPAGLFEEKLSERMEAKRQATEDEFISNDYQTLKRRFNAFWGPAYSKDVVTNGITRLDVIQPPYNRNNFSKINGEMRRRSADREGVARQWKNSLGNSKISVTSQMGVKKPEGFVMKQAIFVNVALFLLLLSVESSLYYTSISVLRVLGEDPQNYFIFLFAFLILFTVIETLVVRFLIFLCMPKKQIKFLSKSLLAALEETGKITSPTARVKVVMPKNSVGLFVELEGASSREQEIFATALNEVLSPVENPAYIFVKKNVFGLESYSMSFACPSVLAKNERDAEIFHQKLKETGYVFNKVYTRSVEGRRKLIKARKRSFTGQNDTSLLTHRKIINPNYQ